jgi:hypothetical protein
VAKALHCHQTLNLSTIDVIHIGPAIDYVYALHGLCEPSPYRVSKATVQPAPRVDEANCPVRK